MRMVSAADDMQAHPRKIAVTITFAKNIRFIVFPSLNTAKHFEIVDGTPQSLGNGYDAILSMTLWPFRVQVGSVYNANSSLAFLYSIFSFVSFDNCLWFCKS